MTTSQLQSEENKIRLNLASYETGRSYLTNYNRGGLIYVWKHFCGQLIRNN